MSKWREYLLGDISAWFSGGTPSKNNPSYWNGNIPWISAKSMNWYKVNSSDLNISSEGAKNGSRIAEINDILLLVRGSGLFNDIPISLVEKPVAFNQDIKAIRSKNSAYQEFLFFWLYGNKKRLYDILEETGIGAGKFDTDLLKKLTISIPTSNLELDLIVNIAKSIFDKIDLLLRQNATLEALAETLFRQWFVEEAKEDWEYKKLKEITDIGIGRTPPRKEFHWFSNNPSDVKWISIKDLGDDGVFISKTSEYLTTDAVKKFRIPSIPKGTVVLSFKMTVGRVAITDDDMLSNEAIAHFKFNTKTPFTTEYLYVFLKSYRYDSLGSTSSIVTAINSSMIKDIEIVIPDSDTMSKFKEITVPMFNKIKENQAQIRYLTIIRDTLLPKLMSGEVRVALDSQPEPAASP